MKTTKPLSRKTELQRGKGLGRKAPAESASALKKGRGFAASPAQQKKAHTEPCIVTGEESIYGATIDPAHLCATARGGCSDPDCVVPLRRDKHHAFDGRELDLLPFLVGTRTAEIQHALGPGHYDGNLLGLLQRLTGRRWGAEG